MDPADRRIPSRPPSRLPSRPGSRPRLRRAAWLVLLAACSEPAAPVPPGSGEPVPEAPAAVNAVDRIVVPLIQASGRSVTVEAPEALCRRLALDLTGVVPTAAEISARCIGHTPAEMVDYFMGKPLPPPYLPRGEAAYVYTSRRAWADLFGYRTIDSDLTTAFYADVLELDALVKQLYEGTLSYDRFATEALIAPAFLRRFGLLNTAVSDTPSIAAAAVHLFLGREALPSDAADLGNLWRPFMLQSVAASFAKAKYPSCTFCSHLAVTVRNGACSGSEALLCQSSALGPIRLGALSVPTVPPSTLPPRPSELTGATGSELRRIGQLFVQRREFAEAAVDRALQRYLGWWLAGVYRPDYELPAVRDALVDRFIAGGYKLRELEREVLTSVLYTQAQALRPGDISEAPLWAHGPTKQLPAEAFLDTLAAVSGVGLGGCDFRFAAGYNTSGVLDARSRNTAAYTFPVSPGIDPGLYVTVARKLGGCTGGGERGESAGLVPAQAKRETLLKVCAMPLAQSALMPAGLLSATPPATGLPQLLAHQIRLLLGRAPLPAETAALVGLSGLAAEACPTGRCDYAPLASQLCLALFASATSNFY